MAIKPRAKRYLLIAGVILVALFTLWIWWAGNSNPSTQLPPPQSTGTVTTSTPIITTSTIATTTTGASGSTSAPVGHAIGVAVGGTLSKLATSTLNAELNQMVALGVTWVRFDIEWGDVQYGSSSTADSTWGSYDTLVAALAAHHLHGLGVITYTPQWARTATCYNGVECPPADPATFATFAAEVAARYKNEGVNAWEIWNEPNNYSFWAPTTDCAAYTALLKATYPAIKAANPNAIVVTGGLSPASTDGNNTSPTDFLSCIYTHGGKGYFDAVGDHPYTFPAFPSADNGGAWDQMSATTPSLRSIMVANGDANKRIWITEFGTPTDGPDPQWYVSEASETEMVADTIQLYRTYDWAGPLFWYTFKDGGTDTSTNENFFGLVRADGSTKPAYQELKSLISAGL
ncbi:MAG TPA: cellulase family glycosylhydrolase [Candidatus Paceibacterota bacterium]|nr:cellulase family glycosylhydrolase [Candidatus Paceibacterota bacterium]